MANETRTLRPKNRILKAGIELEGGWANNPPTPVIHDGSVKFPAPELRPQPMFSTTAERYAWVREEQTRLDQAQFRHIGEIVSPPMEATEPTVTDFVTANYPTAVNDTCGLHVHMSFKHRLNYQRLMTPEFTKAMVVGLREWAEQEKLPKGHPLWPRLLDPDHRHCAHIYCGEEQSKQVSKDYQSRGKAHSRYTAINYCYNQHQTVECRLLSMMDTPEQAVRAVMEVLRITNRFLAKVRARELKVGARVATTTIPTVSRHRVTV